MQATRTIADDLLEALEGDALAIACVQQGCPVEWSDALYVFADDSLVSLESLQAWADETAYVTEMLAAYKREQPGITTKELARMSEQCAFACLLAGEAAKEKRS